MRHPRYAGYAYAKRAAYSLRLEENHSTAVETFRLHPLRHLVFLSSKFLFLKLITSGIFGVADYETEVKITKFKILLKNYKNNYSNKFKSGEFF